ncbi:Uncharacterised protein [Prevotella pallens]|uniref:Uncharacterized protein n=1 Tax=Prevotella pallens TaxID=60133 RepID=A0A379F1T7_9BACT|nr:Uncharacterised protein [Prevotella pallens]
MNISNYSAIMNVEYQELINVTLWQKRLEMTFFIRICMYPFM